MDDSPIQESSKITNNTAGDDEIDPLDAYMLEIDKEVKQLQSQPKVAEDTSMEPELEEYDAEGDDEVDAKLKTGNFTSVEELIA